MTASDLGRLARAALLVPFPGPTAPRWVLDHLERGLGGVTLFAINGNVPGNTALAALTAELRKAGDPVITIDEEGGDVTRLAHTTGSPYPGNAALGAVDDPELTRRVHRSLGAELAGVGVNLNFAPSVDVNTADDNPVIGTRAFGSDPVLVARHAAAATAGLQEAGVAACAKHFPGHGATREDSHLSVPIVDADLELLDRRELVPFRAAIEAGVKAVMTAHLNVPAITDGQPATLSHAAITGLLRGRLGHDGVVVTDALDMRGASGEIGIPEAAVRALNAGADLLCLGSQEYEDSVRAILDAIVAAVRSGRLAEERLAEAAERTERLKAWLAPGGAGTVDAAVGMEAARRAVRLSGELPEAGSPLVIELHAPGNIAVGPVPWGLGPWLPAADLVRVDGDPVDPADLLERANGRPLVLVVRDAHRDAGQRELVSTLLAGRSDAVVVEMGLPVWRPESAGFIATYGAAYANGRAAAELLGLAGE
ncbi:glycoside hydrolase family 3 protein [Actinomadura alba]|uniref:Glycoside hydrolase family 3 protein n=1 Tax=Actinomadura alba TaxID=406431 RepID=A0ABR7LHS4_9ACTN|nr:glycoside hydrolase family 3 protein [Actinomadura alba]MBC6464052.1 glycoside hydrolase family 3 protein [Actinomadura alba]